MMPAINAMLLLAVLAQADTTARGIDAFRQGRYQEAAVDLAKAVQADPKDHTARAFLAMNKAALHDCASANEELAHNPDASLARMAGIAAVECHSAAAPDLAFTTLATLRKRFPNDPDVLYESAKMHQKAWDASVREMFVKAPSSYRVNQLSAEVFETQGKYGEAAAQYDQAIRKAPDALNLHYRLARCLLLESQTPEALDKARVQFEVELKLNPSDAVAEYQVGQILAAQQKHEQAEQHFERALQIRPGFAEALIAVGKARSQGKQFEQAAELFRKAITLQPNNEAAHYNLMLAYRNLGRSADALTEKKELDRLQKPPEGEFSEFLKKLGEKAPEQ